jgi:hypothetical protein
MNQRRLDVVRISRQLRHARPSIVDVCSHEFEEVTHADDVDEKLTAAFRGCAVDRALTQF